MRGARVSRHRFCSRWIDFLFWVFLCLRAYNAKIFIYSQLAVNAYISIEYLHLNVSIRHLYKGLKIVTESLETRARQAPLGDESAYLRDLKRSQKIWVKLFLSESPATYNGNWALYNGKKGSFLQSITGIPAAYNAQAAKACLVRGIVAQISTTDKHHREKFIFLWKDVLW